MSPSRRAFTVAELLAAVAIVAVLIGIAVPTLTRMRAGGLATECLSHLRQIGIGLNLYLDDHNQELPTLAAGRSSRSEDLPVIDTVLGGYLPSPAVFACPADPRIFAISGASYYWNSALNGQRIGALNFLALEDASSRIPVLSDKEGWHRHTHRKVNILYADGHATRGLTF